MSHQYKITSGTLKVGKNFLKAVQKPRLKVFDPVGKVVPALPAIPAVDATSMDVQISVLEDDDAIGLALAASTSQTFSRDGCCERSTSQGQGQG